MEILFISLHCVFEQRDDGEGSNAARDGGYPAAEGVHLAMFHIADDAVATFAALVGDAVDTHIDDHCSVFHLLDC